jgi:hypothetical protein
MGDLVEQGAPIRVWFSTAEAAAAIGKSVDTLNRWANEQRIPGQLIRDLPRGFLWHRDWLASPLVFKFAGKEAPQTWQESGVVRTGNRETAQGGNRV